MSINGVTVGIGGGNINSNTAVFEFIFPPPIPTVTPLILISELVYTVVPSLVRLSVAIQPFTP